MANSILRVKLGDNPSAVSSYENRLKVNFLYLSSEDSSTYHGHSTSVPPQKASSYDNLRKIYKKNGVILMNYTDDLSSQPIEDWEYGIPTVKLNYLRSLSIYRNEIWYTRDKKGEPVLKESIYYIPVTNHDVSSQYLIDYNISNNRYYKYICRFSYTNEGDKQEETLTELVVPVKVRWNGWSITELHKQEDYDGTIYYTASLKDVWKFKNNLQINDTTQNISKTQQDTLGRFPKFVMGPKNSLTSSLTCLLGRDVLPADYYNTDYNYQYKDGKWQWIEVDSDIYNIGGYKEHLWDNAYYMDETSNKPVDMLEKWREFCFSENPKLLKDNKGQKFIVQIHDVSDRIEDGWNDRPISISFSWTQIQSADDLCIIEEVDETDEDIIEEEIQNSEEG